MSPVVALGGFGASAIGDPDGTRTVIAIVALLVVLGLALIMLAFWLRRSTRPDPEFLAPLEAMGERSWRDRDAVWQRRRLDEIRSARAKPLNRPVRPPSLDESFDVGPSAPGFDDLHDPPGGSMGADEVVAADATKPVSGIGHAADDVDLDRPDGDSAHDQLDDGDTAAGDTAAGDADDLAERVAIDGDPTPTPIYAERPLDDFSEREIDPDELAKAMAELDEELRRRSPDQ